MRAGGGNKDQGFVLVSVLVLLVILTLLAAAAATSAERTLAAAAADIDRFESELALDGTRETVLFLLLTQRRTVAGVTVNPSDTLASTFITARDDDAASVMPVGNEIRLDGTAYQGLGTARFAIQDDRGLINPNWAAQVLRLAWYESLGIPAEQWEVMDARRLDYQDADDLHRLNGAEKEHYLRAGLPPPSNHTVTTPLEWRRVLGWERWLAGLDDAQLLAILGSAQYGDLNLNTAPAAVLELLPGLTREMAQRIVQLRRATPILFTWQAMQTFGIPAVLDEMLSIFPGQSGNLVLWDQHAGTRQLLHWTLTPFAEDGALPWRIDYEVILPRGDESDQGVAGTPATPFFSAPGTAGEFGS